MSEAFRISIASEFATNPGARYPSDGPKSGEEFRRSLLQARFFEAREAGKKLVVDLDGTEGYATSFLEEAFGGLAREYPIAQVQETLDFISEDEPGLIAEIRGYIADARDP